MDKGLPEKCSEKEDEFHSFWFLLSSFSLPRIRSCKIFRDKRIVENSLDFRKINPKPKKPLQELFIFPPSGRIFKIQKMKIVEIPILSRNVIKPSWVREGVIWTNSGRYLLEIPANSLLNSGFGNK